MGSGTRVLPTGSRARSGDEQAGPFTPPTPAPVALLNIHDSAGFHVGLGPELSVGPRFSLSGIRAQWGWGQGSVFWDQGSARGWDQGSVCQGSGLSGAGVKVQSSGIGLTAGLGSGFSLLGSGLSAGLGSGYSEGSFLPSTMKGSGLLPALPPALKITSPAPGVLVPVLSPHPAHALPRQGLTYAPLQAAMEWRQPILTVASHHLTPTEGVQGGKCFLASLTGPQKHSKDSQPSGLNAFPSQGEVVLG